MFCFVFVVLFSSFVAQSMLSKFLYVHALELTEMDDMTVSWSHARYDECVKWATTYAKTLGFTAGKG